MIDSITIENFKSCKEISIELGSITLLSGVNGSGKSTVLQVLSLVKQSMKDDSSMEGFARLNGDLVSLGKGRDILSQMSDNDMVSIRFEEPGQRLNFVFNANSDQSTLTFYEYNFSLEGTFLTRPFQLISADRLVPKTVYPQKQDGRYGKFFIGKSGEYAGGFIEESERLKDIELFPNRLTRSSNAKAADAGSFIDCIVAWLDIISPGASVSSELVPGTDFVTLRYSYSGIEGLGVTEKYRPSNVGFGLTYSLPVIVSALSLPRGSTLLVENPEAHLHPSGQLNMGVLLALAAADGVQVIVETHSDHLLNGIRLAVRNGDIEKHLVRIHFMKRDVQDGETFVLSPEVDDSGKLSFWPDGFFDEYEKALRRLI